MERERAVTRCAYCQTSILDQTRAVRTPEGYLLDVGCAKELAREGQLAETDLPIVRGGSVIGYLHAYWSETLDHFVTVPGAER
jgi:hypothetical protein